MSKPNDLISGQNTGGILQSSQIADLMMTNLIMSKFGEIFKSDVKLSAGNISKLAAIVFLSEGKGVIKNAIAKFPPVIYDFIIMLISYLKNIYINKYSNRKPKTINININSNIDNISNNINENDRNQINNINRINKKSIKIIFDNTFMNGIYDYLKYNPNSVIYDKKTLGIEMLNCKEKIIKKELSNIKITIDNYKFKINGNFSYIIDFDSKKVKSCVTANSYYDFFTKTQQKFIKEIISTLKIPEIIESHKNIDLKAQDNTLTLYKLAKMISDKYNFNNDEIILIMMVIQSMQFHYSIDTICGKNIKSPLEQLNNEGINVYDPSGTYMEYKHKFSNFLYHCLIPYATIKNIVSKLPDNNEIFAILSRKEIKLYSKQTVTIKNLQLNDFDEDEAIEILFNEISKHNINDSNSKVTSYYLELEVKKDIIKTENPLYKVWLEKKKLFESFGKLINNDNNTNDRNNDRNNNDRNNNDRNNNDKNNNEDKIKMKMWERFLEMPIPEEYIEEEKITKNIMNKKIGEIRKDISTLYLRKSNMNSLLSSLSQFRDHKDILAKHGLRNKLNIILYGLPGTGKSTTIDAVATYLGKDIYYVDLNNASSNADLHMMFDYVNKNVKNGGIVVLEDIDSMTDLVLQRSDVVLQKNNNNNNNNTNNNNNNNNNVNKINLETVSSSMKDIDSKITLEYFLNILQGTLTMEDSVFIVTTNYFNKLDTAFVRDGRFDVKLELKMCDHYQIKTIYKDFIGREIPEDLLKRIEIGKYSPATIIYHLKDYLFRRQTDDYKIMKNFISNI